MAVPADVVPRHTRPWTLDEVLALPTDSGDRIELIDGNLVMSPAPTRQHQRLLRHVLLALDAAAPDGVGVELSINVVLNEHRLLIPDLAVTTTPPTGLYAGGAEVLVAIEITSPSSRTYDRVLKRQLYAEAVVPYYLIVDTSPSPPQALLYELRGDEYVEAARSEDGVLRLDRPFKVTIDLTSDTR